MKQYKVPTVGSTITVTTRYPSHYKYSDEDYDEYTYTDVPVVRPFDWMNDDEFRVKDVRVMGHGIVFFDRIIKVKNIVEMTGEMEEVTDDFRIVECTSKRTGEVYKVTIEYGKGTHCTCKGFQFRHRCSHLKTALNTK